MAVKRKPEIKATFETGDRPTQAEFADFIDSYVPIETDGAVGFMEVISTASSLARPSETLVALATAVQGGKTGIIEVLATADVTALSAGVVGREVLSAIATASAQGHLGAGTIGTELFEAATTASARGHLGIVTASETVFGIVEIATQAEMEAAAAIDRAVVPARQQFHDAHPKAVLQVSVAAGVPTLNFSFGVSSVDDDGVGLLGINFSTDFSDLNYATIAQVADAALASNVVSCHENSSFTKAVGATQLIHEIQGGANRDPVEWFCSVYGDQ